MRDRAVWSPIYTISGTLDTTLSEIFMPNYPERLDAAKERLRADLYGDADGPAASGRDADAAPQAHQIERGITVQAAEPDEVMAQPLVQVSAQTGSK